MVIRYTMYFKVRKINLPQVIAHTNLPAIWHSYKVCGGKQTIEEIKASRLLSCNQRFTLALFPAITVSCGGCSFQSARKKKYSKTVLQQSTRYQVFSTQAGVLAEILRFLLVFPYQQDTKIWLKRAVQKLCISTLGIYYSCFLRSLYEGSFAGQLFTVLIQENHLIQNSIQLRKLD